MGTPDERTESEAATAEPTDETGTAEPGERSETDGTDETDETDDGDAAADDGSSDSLPPRDPETGQFVSE